MLYAWPFCYLLGDSRENSRGRFLRVDREKQVVTRQSCTDSGTRSTLAYCLTLFFGWSCGEEQMAHVMYSKE